MLEINFLPELWHKLKKGADEDDNKHVHSDSWPSLTVILQKVKYNSPNLNLKSLICVSNSYVFMCIESMCVCYCVSYCDEC